MTRFFAALLVLIGALILSTKTFAGDVKPAEFVVCKSAKSVRTLSVTPDSKSGTATCKVTYTKGGVSETVGEHTTKASCKSILDHVKGTLENSNWNCRNVSATVTTSAEVSRQ